MRGTNKRNIADRAELALAPLAPLRGREVFKLLFRNDLQNSPSGRVGRGSGRRGFADPPRAYSRPSLKRRVMESRTSSPQC